MPREQVVSGQVTQAVRNTSIDGVDIQEGDYMGIKEKTIVSSKPSLLEACQLLMATMVEDGGELLTVLTGEDAKEADIEMLCEWIEEAYPDVELEVHVGGQPLYPYLFALE